MIPRIQSCMIALACASAWSSMGFAQSSCPTNTRAHAGSCVLDSNIVLTQPLELPSFTTLNCRGHVIAPTSQGSGSTAQTYVASVPALAVAITGERAVDVRNCIIGQDGARFDFGIIAVSAKAAGAQGHRIHRNEVHARDSAITLLDVDDSQVNDNVITWTNGFGVWVGRDSDRNRVNDNLMSSPGAAPAVIRVLPNGPFRDLVDQGVFVASLAPTPLLNLAVGGRLYQFPNSRDGAYPGPEDNVIEGNHLSLPGSSAGKSHEGVLVASNAARTRVAENTIVQAALGVRLAGMGETTSVSRPSRCSTSDGQQSSRFCQTDADCFVAGIDPAPLGTCPPMVTELRDLRGRENVVADNLLLGPFNATQAASRTAILGGNGSLNCVIRGNHVFGTGAEAGIALASAAIETATVTGNVVQGASVGLLLQQGIAQAFAARVFLNDILASTSRAIGVLGPYTLPTELSWNGLGNHWGHTTPPCFSSTDSPIPSLIQDSHAFCGPIAASSAE